MNKTDLINKIDKAMDRLDFLAEIKEEEKALTACLNNICNILLEIRVEVHLTELRRIKMFSLSKESKFELLHTLFDLVENFLKSKNQTEQRLLGLMTAKLLKDELNIKDNTLKRWEEKSLERYQPPYNNKKIS